MTEYWEDESDGKPRHGVGVVRHRPHRIVRHRDASPTLSLFAVGTIAAAACLLVASVATGVSMRDTRAAGSRTMADPAAARANPPGSTESAETAPGGGSGGVDPGEDAERRSAVAADTERADRSGASRAPSAPAVSDPPADPPATVQASPDPSPPADDEPSVDPTPDPTADPCKPRKGKPDGGKRKPSVIVSPSGGSEVPGVDPDSSSSDGTPNG